jgi:hypothetical protein
LDMCLSDSRQIQMYKLGSNINLNNNMSAYRCNALVLKRAKHLETNVPYTHMVPVNNLTWTADDAPASSSPSTTPTCSSHAANTSSASSPVTIRSKLAKYDWIFKTIYANFIEIPYLRHQICILETNLLTYQFPFAKQKHCHLDSVQAWNRRVDANVLRPPDRCVCWQAVHTCSPWDSIVPPSDRQQSSRLFAEFEPETIDDWLSDNKLLTLQLSGGINSRKIGPPCTQNRCNLTPVVRSQRMTAKSAPPDTNCCGLYRQCSSNGYNRQMTAPVWPLRTRVCGHSANTTFNISYIAQQTIGFRLEQLSNNRMTCIDNNNRSIVASDYQPTLTGRIQCACDFLSIALKSTL